MLRTALRNVLAHKARLLMTVLAVLLGVAFVAGTMVFTSTISEAYQKSAQSSYSDVDVSIRPDGSRTSADNELATEPPSVSQHALDRMAKRPEVESATGVAEGFTALGDKDGGLVGDGFSTKGANYYTSGEDSADPRYPLIDGRGPRNADEVALDEKTAERTGYEVGDTAVISIDGPVRKPRVSGIFHSDDGNVAAGGSLVLFDNATAQRLFTEPGEYGEALVKAADGTSQEELRTALAQFAPDGFGVVTGHQLSDDEARMIERSMSGMQTGMLAFAGIALFVGIFIIVNTFTMLVAQRTKELALLRAVGASRRQVTRSVLVEAAVVGLIASVLGIGAGVGIAAVLREFADSTGTMPQGPLQLTGSAVLSSLLVGVLVTVLAAWLPARRAARIPPVAAMGSQHVPATTRSLVVRNTLGSLLAAAGAALVWYATMLSDGKAPMAIGAVLLLIGVFVLTPLLSRPLIALASPALRLFGVSGRLARLNAVRTPRRTAATASALMIGLTLVTGLSVIAASAQQAIDKQAADALKADYTISMANASPLDPEVGEKLQRVDGVTATSPLREGPAKIDNERDYVSGVNAHSIEKLTSLDFSAGSWSGLGSAQRPGVVVDEDTAKDHHWQVGSRLTVAFEDGAEQRFTVGGIYAGNEVLMGVVLDYKLLTPHLSDLRDSKLFASMADGPEDTAKASIQRALGSNPAILVKDQEDLSESTAETVSLMLNVLYGLLGMAVLVAVLGVINTLAMSVFERSQEIGMLRAIGLERRGVRRMVRLESVVISHFGGVLGVALGIFLAWGVGDLIAGEGFGAYEMTLPWGSIGVFLLLSAVVGVLAAVWPARRAARMNMLEALKTE